MPTVKSTAKPPAKKGKYEQKKKREASRSREINEAGREIGPPPKTRDHKRYEACRKSLRLFCETYLAHWFPLKWSADHLKAIARLEAACLVGGRFAFAMPRGSGKTTLCQAAAIWAVLYGHRRFTMVIGASAPAAGEILEALKEELECNDLLLVDFSEVCFPIRALDGIANRCKGQTIDGKRTRIEWTKNQIVLPRVGGSPASGAILRVRGITGRVRGSKHGSQRPDLVILDDPQTDASAASYNSTKKRMHVIERAILKLAGPKQTIAICMPCTCIQPGDLVDQYLDRDKHPAWNGERWKMLYAFPKATKLWDEYANLRAESLRVHRDGRLATAFYKKNRKLMDAGAEVAWPERFEEGELSGLQSAMNLWIDDPASFKAECQNAPQKETSLDELRQITEDDLAAKLNTLPRGTVPRSCTRLTAFIDVQAEMLFWAVCGWDEKFGGSLIAYGCFPKQGRDIFTAAEPNPGLSKIFPKLQRGARIYAALSQLVPLLFAKQWDVEDTKTKLSLSLCLIDARFETDTVHDFISRSPVRALLKPSMGRGIGAAGKPMNDYRKANGDVVGWNWRIDAQTKAKGRYVSYDGNPWKSFVAEAILAASGSPGSFHLPGQKIREHPLLSIHLTSEHRTPTYGHGRNCEEWRIRPETRENHWWDGIVGCAVAASVSGLKWTAAALLGMPAASKTPRKKRNFAEEQRRARERREESRS